MTKHIASELPAQPTVIYCPPGMAQLPSSAARHSLPAFEERRTAFMKTASAAMGCKEQVRAENIGTFRQQEQQQQARSHEPEEGNDFLGIENSERVIDPTLGIKTISTGYCGFNGERAKIKNQPVLCGRIGGVVFGVERQLRNPEVATKNPEMAEYGTALVGNFNADTYNDDGEIVEYAEVGFCYLPSGFHEAALARFASMPEEAQKRGMTFSVFCYAVPRGNLRGYGWMLKNAMRVEKNIRTLQKQMAAEARLIAEQQQFALPKPALDFENAKEI